jgi:Carboxypeptidase regulatory-like domain
MSTILRSRSAFFLRFLIVLAVCAISTAAVAQVTSGTIFGSVTDVSGAVVPNATVTVRSAEIGVTRTTTSSAEGGFVVPNLPPATYTITSMPRASSVRLLSGS